MWQKVNFIHEIAFSLSSFTIHRIRCRKMGPNWHWSTNQWNVQGKLLLRLGIEIWVFPGSSVKEEEQVRAQYIGTQNYFAFCWSIKANEMAAWWKLKTIEVYLWQSHTRKKENLNSHVRNESYCLPTKILEEVRKGLVVWKVTKLGQRDSHPVCCYNG